MSSQGKWIPPLPHGWEARWAPDQKAYFYINHMTRKTQWDDPRFPVAQGPTASAAAHSLGHGGSSQNASHTSQDGFQMRDMSPYRKSPVNPPSHHQEAAESNLSVEVDQAVVNKLLKDFPKAKRDLIVDILRLCHDNEREAREQLKEFGFEASKPQSTAAHHPAKSPERQPVKTEPSEIEKKRMLTELQTMFPDIKAHLLGIALKSTQYDKDGAATILRAWAKNEPGGTQEAASRTSRGGTPTTSSSSTTSPTPAPVSLMPAALTDPASLRPSSSSEDPRDRRAPNTQRVAQTKNQKKASPSHGQHISAAQVTKRTRRAKPTSQQVVTAQPKTSVASSPAHQTLAKGPDPGLRKGPDTSLLNAEYTQACGPDKKLRAGADRSRAVGPQGAHGTDVSLRCGPQSSFVMGSRNAHMSAIPVTL